MKMFVYTNLSPFSIENISFKISNEVKISKRVKNAQQVKL